MERKKVVNSVIYLLICGLSGTVIGLIVWCFLRLMNLGIELLWVTVADAVDFKFYPLVVCTIGGLIIGIYNKKTGVAPEELQDVITKVRSEHFYPYDKIGFLLIAAFLPLLFGGSIGPEAGLTGVIVGLCYWARDNMKYGRQHLDRLTEVAINSTFTAIFLMPLFGASALDMVDTEAEESKWFRIVSNLIAIFSSFGVLILMNQIFGGSAGLPKITEFNISMTERKWGIVLALVGVICGYIFLFFEKSCHNIFCKIKRKIGVVAPAVMCGVVLGMVGSFMPFTMFSGEESMVTLSETYTSYGPGLLVATGLVKLLLTNLCISSGWKGGHFFPVIFCGISIGFGIGMVLGLDLDFCGAVVTAGLLGTLMPKPIMVCILLVIIFDLRMLFWIVLAILLGSLIRIIKLKLN